MGWKGCLYWCILRHNNYVLCTYERDRRELFRWQYVLLHCTRTLHDCSTSNSAIWLWYFHRHRMASPWWLSKFEGRKLFNWRLLWKIKQWNVLLIDAIPWPSINSIVWYEIHVPAQLSRAWAEILGLVWRLWHSGGASDWTCRHRGNQQSSSLPHQRCTRNKLWNPRARWQNGSRYPIFQEKVLAWPNDSQWFHGPYWGKELKTSWAYQHCSKWSCNVKYVKFGISHFFNPCFWGHTYSYSQLMRLDLT